MDTHVDSIHLILPEQRIWLSFYADTSWVCVYHAGEYYWAEFHDPDDPDRFLFDTVADWLAAVEARADE